MSISHCLFERNGERETSGVLLRVARATSAVFQYSCHEAFCTHRNRMTCASDQEGTILKAVDVGTADREVFLTSGILKF